MLVTETVVIAKVDRELSDTEEKGGLTAFLSVVALPLPVLLLALMSLDR